tara:strand:- start:3852 stop:4376 length:525 start_codon:yes stop_codon:yes gene_type:complete
MGKCNFISERTGNPCGSTKDLHTVIFFDNEIKESQTVQLCQLHSNQVFSIYNHAVDELTKNIDKMKKQKTPKKKSDYGRIQLDNEWRITERINKHYQEISRIRFNVCREVTCGVQLSSKSNRFSCFLLSNIGKNRLWLYFCNRRHYDICRARCGVRLPIHNKQLPLDSVNFLTQ